MIVKEKLEALRKLMKEKKIDAYIIPTSDFHETEYVGDYFKAREFMSGFSGSVGTLIVCKESAALWVDGRYFIQASKELENSTIEMMKVGVEGTPTMAQYLFDHVQDQGVLGFDGRVMNTALVNALLYTLKKKQITCVYNDDLVDLIWEQRPSLAKGKSFLFDEKYCGKSTGDKLADIRSYMRAHQCDYHIMTTLDDIAWTFNMRGNDIPCFPVILAFAVITLDTAYLFVDQEKICDELKVMFEKYNVVLKEYEAIYSFVSELKEGAILLDPNKVNYKITQSLNENMKVIGKSNPTQIWKAKKNETELKNIKQAHIKDGVAVVKFLYWLKNNVAKMTITEASAAEKIDSLRKEQEGFIEPSFHTISAYNENAAMMHYRAVANKCATLQPEGFLLIDSGGQYYQGTTDITRTIALGKLSDTMKLHFTTVLKSMISLSKATFLHGCSGRNLDILARGPIWNLGIDYRSGTGHGIGFLLNVHEAPNGFRWRKVGDRNDGGTLEEGMVTSNEPGIYIEGQYGIRIENEIVVKKDVENEYGQFMKFDTVTFAPIDLDAIDPSVLTTEEKAWLNAYHQMVYENLAPHLETNEKVWLKEYTREI